MIPVSSPLPAFVKVPAACVEALRVAMYASGLGENIVSPGIQQCLRVDCCADAETLRAVLVAVRKLLAEVPQ